jgi:hypothetical protein
MTQAPSELVEQIFDFVSLLGIVLAGPDADTAIDGMHRVVLEIRERTELLREALKSAATAA